jgi:uncharacterized protein
MRLSRITSLCAIALATHGCTPSELTTAGSVAMANPASVACVIAGGKLLAKQNKQGEYAMCKLPSGKVCEEWALFRGECL